MFHQIQEIDTSIFLLLNGLHADWADFLMYWTTQRNTWIPLYTVLIGCLIWQYKRQSAVMIGCLVATIVLADQFTSALLKPLVQRLRPCHVVYLQNKIHAVTDCGGQYGFASSHAANSFGLAMALWLLLGRKYAAVKWFFVWAAVVSYSRIYVGVHYPIDVVVGAMVGMVAAWICFELSKKIKLLPALAGGKNKENDRKTQK
jgi:undecaprenyl-diphosphatase